MFKVAERKGNYKHLARDPRIDFVEVWARGDIYRSG